MTAGGEQMPPGWINPLTQQIRYVNPYDISRDSTSEWLRLAATLGFDGSNRDIGVYISFADHVSSITNGNYSRIRSPDNLDEQGKRLL